MIGLLAQASSQVELPTSIGALLIAAIGALAGCVGYVGRWLMLQFEKQAAAFTAAMAAQQESCKSEIRLLTEAFERDAAADRESRRDIASRTAEALGDVQMALVRLGGHGGGDDNGGS